jgi:hypothetical protein
MCSCDVDGHLEFSTTTTPRARKAHRCDECWETIAPGDTYERTAGKWEGSMFVNTICLTCAAWGDAFAKEQRRVCGCTGWVLGQLWDAIEEHEEEHGWGGPSLAEQREKDAARYRSSVMAPAVSP